MDKFSSIKNFLSSLGRLFLILLTKIVQGYRNLKNTLRLRFNWFDRFIRRHETHPTTMILDGAVIILGLYIIFGVIAFVKIYPQKSETKFTQNLARLYPYPAARVSDSIVWNYTFLERVHFLNVFNSASQGQNNQSLPTQDQLRGRVLEALIDSRIVLLESKKTDISVSPDELDAALAKQKQNQCLDDQQKPRDCTNAEFNAQIKKLYDMNSAQFKTILAELVLEEKLKNIVISRVRLRHIFTTSQDQAKQAKKELDAGKTFPEAAKQYSQDANTKDADGDLGYWRKGELVKSFSPTVEDAAFSLSANQISDVLQTQAGFEIIQITERTGTSNQTYADWLTEKKNAYTIRRYVSTT